MSFVGIGNPLFTPAPSPDFRGETSFQFMVGSHTFDVLLGFAVDPGWTVGSWSWGAFNPQPEPPGSFVTMQFQALPAVQAQALVDPQMSFSILEDGSPLDLALAPTPVPAALPLFASGLGGFGLLQWRRRRKHAALATA